MALYQNSNNKLTLIKEEFFKYEKDIQKLTEENLELLFGLEVVKSECVINNFRIDTLSFDRESKSFVIIEYKKDKNFSVIDQGYAYLSLMLNNKADFILEYNENNKHTIKRDDIDWSQSRVLFISPFFTTYQIESINFRDLPISLWTIKKYSNQTVIYEQIQSSIAKESIKTIKVKNENINVVSKEIKVYTEEEHLSNVSAEIVELYEKIKSMILNIAQIEIKPKELYIAFTSGSNIVDVRIQKNSLKLWINLKRGELDDPKRIMRDVSGIGHWGNGDYEIQIDDEENIDYILSLVKQSYRLNMK